MFSVIKLLSASTTASLQDWKHLQALATVFLLRLPITSFISTRESEVLWGVLLRCSPVMPHTKRLRGSGELGDQNSERWSRHQSWLDLPLWVGALSCWKT